jgi:uncharacterized protein
MSDEHSSLHHCLKTCHTIAVVGLSAEPDRPSFGVAQYMQAQGYRIVPVNPKYTEILGEQSYARLSDIPFPVDMVNVFRKTADVLPVAEEAVRIGAKCLWQQIGVDNPEAAALVHKAGLLSVADRCLKIEHARLLGNLVL